MTRRNGSVIKAVVGVVIILLSVYFVYLFNDVSGRLKDTERTAERYRREHESLSAQLQDLNAAHEDLRQRCDADKQEFINRLNSLNQQHKMLKSQHEDVESEYGRLQQENQKVKQDQKQMEEQRNQEYMQLKQEKDLEISNLRDKIANAEREKERVTGEVENLKVQLQNSLIQIQGDQRTQAELQRQLQEKQHEVNQNQDKIRQLQQQVQRFQSQLNAQQSMIGQNGQQPVGGLVNMQQGGGANQQQGGGANLQQQGGGANLQQQGGGANQQIGGAFNQGVGANQQIGGVFNQQGGALQGQQGGLFGSHGSQGRLVGGILHQQGHGGQGSLQGGAQNVGEFHNVAQNVAFQNLLKQDGDNGQQNQNPDVHQQDKDGPGLPNANDGQHQIAPPGNQNRHVGYQRDQDKQENVNGGNGPPENVHPQILKPNLDEVVDNNGGENHAHHPAPVDGAADKQDQHAPKQVDLQVAPPQFGQEVHQGDHFQRHVDQEMLKKDLNLEEDDDVEARKEKGPIDDNNEDYDDDNYDKNLDADEDQKDDGL